MKHETVLTETEVSDFARECVKSGASVESAIRKAEQAVLAKLEQRQEPVARLNGLTGVSGTGHIHPPTDTTQRQEPVARSALTLDRPMTFGGCPVCGRQNCVAGECQRTNQPTDTALLEAAEKYMAAMDAYTRVVRHPLTTDFDKAAAVWAEAEKELRAAIEAHKGKA